MFQYEWKCTWGEADPMGIAYYPRLVNAMHLAGEEFMASNGVAYWDIPDDYGINLPVVAQNTEFQRPVEVADVLQITVEPDVGSSSLGLEFTATHEDGGTAYEGHEQHVCVSRETHESQPLPDEVKQALADDSD